MLAGDDGFCSRGALRPSRSVQLVPCETISYSVGIRRTSPNALQVRCRRFVCSAIISSLLAGRHARAGREVPYDLVACGLDPARERGQYLLQGMDLEGGSEVPLQRGLGDPQVVLGLHPDVGAAVDDLDVTV